MARRMAAPPPSSWGDKRNANVVAKAAKRPKRQPDRSVKTVTETYTVVGNRTVAGTCPGDTVELTLTEGVAQALIEAGHLAIAETTSEER